MLSGNSNLDSVLTLNRAQSSRMLEEIASNVRASILMTCRWEATGPRIEPYRVLEGFWVRHSHQVNRWYANVYPSSPFVENQLASRHNGALVRPTFKFETGMQGFHDIVGERKLILRVLAYIEHSLERISQTFVMLVWNELCLKFSSELRDRLVTNLKLTGDEGSKNCRMLSVDSPGTLRRREELGERQRALRKAIRKLQELENIENEVDAD